MNIPKDPYILLSFVNTKLRDFYTDLDDMCKSLDIDKNQLVETLADFDYTYNESKNQFS